MEEQLTQNDLEEFKKGLIEALCDNNQVKQDVINSVPEYLKPYAHINPYAPDALEQIEIITRIIHPEAVPVHPAWVQKLIDKGLVDTDGKSVLANNLETVAAAIRDNEGIVVEKYHLQRFIRAATKKPYSSSIILKTLEKLNS